MMSSALLHSTTAPAALPSARLQLGCRAASPAAARAAIDAGADWVRIAFRFLPPFVHAARNTRLSGAVRYAHKRGRKLVLDMAVQADLSWQERVHALRWAVEQGFDALAIADIPLALYCATHHPSIPLHIIAPADICPRTARLLKLQTNAARIVVPHHLSPAQLAAICANADVEIEVSAACPPLEQAGIACNDACFLARQGTRDALLRLPLLASIGVRAIQVEPRSDLPDDVANIAYTWRTAIDCSLAEGHCHAAEHSWRDRINMM